MASCVTPCGKDGAFSATGWFEGGGPVGVAAHGEKGNCDGTGGVARAQRPATGRGGECCLPQGWCGRGGKWALRCSSRAAVSESDVLGRGQLGRRLLARAQMRRQRNALAAARPGGRVSIARAWRTAATAAVRGPARGRNGGGGSVTRACAAWRRPPPRAGAAA